MDQTAAGGSLQPVLSWDETLYVPFQGHALHVAFASWAQTWLY